MHHMMVSLNYLVSMMAFISSFLLSKKGELYNNATKFMFFLGSAALLGGFAHHMDINADYLNNLIGQINLKLPALINPLQLNLIHDRVWYAAIEFIGFTEFYFMYLFIYPITHEKFSFIKTYLKIALLIFIIATTISSQYLFVVAFHVFSHIIIIIFALYIYFSKKVTEVLLLVLLATYNLVIGIIQQLMGTHVISSGPLDTNDWYHMGVIIFVIALHLIFTRTNLINNLNKIRL